MPRPAPDRLAAAEATLRTCFAMSGYIRRRSATRLTTDGSTRYHKGDEVRLVSSRPSDAIALAVRTGAEIYAEEAVLDEAASSGDEAAEPEEVVKQFREFIDNVNPEDFAS